MPGTPKPPGQRRRRNTSAGQWVKLRSGVEVQVPRAPAGLGAAGKRWWRDVWGSPMAAVFLPADRHALEQGARLVDHLAEGFDAPARTELRHIEDRFGLTPLARRRLQWEVDQASERAAPRRRNMKAARSSSRPTAACS
jgi:hypothetical protein